MLNPTLKFIPGRLRTSVTLGKLLAIILVAVSIVGCKPATDVADEDGPKTRHPVPTLEVIIVDARELGEEINRLWQAFDGGQLNIRDLTLEEFSADRFAATNNSDLVIYPANKKVDLIAAGRLTEISNHAIEDEDFNAAELLLPYRDSSVKFNGKWFAVSLGEPRPAVFYRADIFERHQLKPPSTWKEYNVVVGELAKLKSQSEQNQNGELEENVSYRVLEMSHSNGLFYNYAIRLAPYLVTRGRYSSFFEIRTLEPLVDTLPFVKAMDDLVTSSDSVEFVPPKDAFEAVINGRAAMVIGWPSAAWKRQTDGTEFVEPLPIKTLSLPQSDIRFDYSRERWVPRKPAPILLQNFNGHLASISEGAPHKTTATKFAMWLASKDTSTRLRNLSDRTAATRASHLGSLDRWIGNDLPDDTKTLYADIVKAYSNADLRLDVPPIPSADQYLTLFDEAIREVLEKRLTPTESLKNLKQQWLELSETLSTDRQRRFYQGGLGL